jgi:2-methylisocitrate lyase-like PEP mutase family enzyme
MSSKTMSSSAFRDLHYRDHAFVMPNPWDIGSARILASMGFEALATTSAGFAFSQGVKDGGVSRDAVLAHCREIVGANPLPVSADLEDGFGARPEEVAETISVAGATGLAGGSIEDYTRSPEDPIYPFEPAVERVAAAVEAARRLDGDFILTARAENFLYDRPDLDDTIRRLQAYEKAGADVLYAPGLKDLDEIREVCAALSKPVNVVMGLSGPSFSVAELSEAGVKRISLGSSLARQAYGELLRAANEVRGDGSFTFGERAPGSNEITHHF